MDATKPMNGCCSAGRPIAALLLFVAACSAGPVVNQRDIADANDVGGTLAAQTPLERDLLQQVASLKTATAQRIGDSMVIADSPYQAASGRRCRSIHVTAAGAGAAVQRLACTNGNAWVFVPDVFGDGPGNPRD
jgi:hypothetical protein